MTAPEILRHSCEIRSLTVSDAVQLRALYSLSLQNNLEGFVQNPDFHGDIAQRAAAYQAQDGAMLGMFLKDGVLLGFGGLKKTDSPGEVELCNLHLDPRYHGQGYGKLLALALLEKARKLGYRRVSLHVTITQRAAIGLYQTLGFNAGRRQVYEVNGVKYDTQFMHLDL